MGELDALTTVNNAKAQAYGLQTQAAGNPFTGISTEFFWKSAGGYDVAQWALVLIQDIRQQVVKARSHHLRLRRSTNSSAFGGLKSIVTAATALPFKD
ncbi:hypothetical protein [Pantoea sp. JZ2]|uniref:hypothetical protein n=1 Tax=Pantoea sp. JZ2 TaxID=2654189 RepID=UPI002B45C1E0|nr:hypothetical protein [Pantoea sp. JZ2]